MTYEDKEYLDAIRSKVDELKLKCGFGEVNVKIEVKDGKVIYLEFVTKERIKVLDK